MKALITLLFGALCFLSQAQSLERQVFASFGSDTQSGPYHLSSTGGEAIVAYSDTPNGLKLLIGFQQDVEILECLGDFNNDGYIDTLDLLQLLAQFMCVQQCIADLNGDQMVNTLDLLAFLGLFGTQCP